jgi:tetratricopeptide (TPR) repeat protein
MRKLGNLGLSLLLLVSLAMPALAQSAQAEYDAYLAFYNEQNPQKKAELAEKFIAEPTLTTSQYRSAVVGGLIRAYAAAQNHAKVLETVDKLGTLLPTADDKTKLAAYQNAMIAAQNADNFPKIMDYGDKTLQLDPNDLNAQMTLATMIPERLPADEAQKKAALDKAYGLAEKAQAQIPKIFDKAPPSGVTAEQWKAGRTGYESQITATMGLIHLNRAEYDKAVEKYEAVLKTNQKDAINQYRLGLAYNSLAAAASNATVTAYEDENKAKRDHPSDQFLHEELAAKRQALEEDFKMKREKALDALAKAVALGGVVATPARQALEKLYATKSPNGSLDGLDQLIAAKKQELG